MSTNKLATLIPLDLYEERAHYRDDIRKAREACQKDAEAFREILFAVERLGSRLLGNTEVLKAYEKEILNVAIESDLLHAAANRGDEAEKKYFRHLFEVIMQGRNDALHQGSVARHLTARAIELALILEDALARKGTDVQFLMAKEVVVAQKWQTLGEIRHIMLANAFSYLPINMGKAGWYFLSDHKIAIYLLTGKTDFRKRQLALRLTDLNKATDNLFGFAHLLTNAKVIERGENATDAVNKMENGVPLLVFDTLGENERLVGILSPADLL